MIYFVRHGQTDDNLNNMVQGNGPLNETGLNQARETAEKLKNYKFDICFCSPMLRTKQTLNEIIKYHKNLKVIYDDRLIERQYYEIIGKSRENLPDFDKRWDNNVKLPYNVETIDQVYSRVSSFYDDLKNSFAKQNILIVSHKGVGRMTNAYFNGKPKDNIYSNFELKNGQFLTFEFKE